METRENILKELQEIAPTLAKMEKRNFYSVPENYFLDFKNGMLETVKMSEVKQELKSIAPALLNIEKKQAKAIPANYFNSFSADLMKKIRAGEVNAELKEIAPALAGIEKKANRHEVLAHYFGAFPQQMLKLIAAEQNGVQVNALPGWLQGLNNVLDSIYARLFKPQYAFVFAGTATVLIMAVMMLAKVEQQVPCNDLACLEKTITDEELNTYLDKNSDVYDAEIFEYDFTNKANAEQVFKNALNTISDEDLDKAILD